LVVIAAGDGAQRASQRVIKREKGQKGGTCGFLKKRSFQRERETVEKSEPARAITELAA